MGFWWAFGGLLVGFWWAFGGLLVGFWWTFGGLLVKFWWEALDPKTAGPLPNNFSNRPGVPTPDPSPDGEAIPSGGDVPHRFPDR